MVAELVPVVLQALPLVVLPNQLLQLLQLPEQHHAPAPVQESRLQDPQVGPGLLVEEGLGADGLAVEVALRPLVELLGGEVRHVLASRQDNGLVASGAAFVGVVAVEELNEGVQGQVLLAGVEI